MTVIGLALGLILVGSMWVFYTRSRYTFFSINVLEHLKHMVDNHDHKQVGILYFLCGFFASAMVGGLRCIRNTTSTAGKYDFLTYDEYNSFFTGTTAAGALLLCQSIAGFMNYILPLQIGAKMPAFPRINALGLNLIVAAAPLMGIWSGEAADITWVMYPPYSSLAGLGTDHDCEFRNDCIYHKNCITRCLFNSIVITSLRLNI